MFPRSSRPQPSKASKTPQPESSMPSPGSDEQAGNIREMFGFDRNDPNVQVTFIPLTRGASSTEDTQDAAAGDATPPTTEYPEPPQAETPKEKWERQGEIVVDILMEVLTEVSRAVSKHAPMNSPHEGHSVIREELEELWDHVKGDTGRTTKARKEAIQIACTAVRYVLDLDPH